MLRVAPPLEVVWHVCVCSIQLLRNVITLLSNMKVLFVLSKKTSKSNYIDLFNLNVISPGTLACTPPHFLSQNPTHRSAAQFSARFSLFQLILFHRILLNHPKSDQPFQPIVAAYFLVSHINTTGNRHVCWGRSGKLGVQERNAKNQKCPIMSLVYYGRPVCILPSAVNRGLLLKKESLSSNKILESSYHLNHAINSRTLKLCQPQNIIF